MFPHSDMPVPGARRDLHTGSSLTFFLSLYFFCLENQFKRSSRKIELAEVTWQLAAATEARVSATGRAETLGPKDPCSHSRPPSGRHRAPGLQRARGPPLVRAVRAVTCCTMRCPRQVAVPGPHVLYLIALPMQLELHVPTQCPPPPARPQTCQS